MTADRAGRLDADQLAAIDARSKHPTGHDRAQVERDRFALLAHIRAQDAQIGELDQIVGALTARYEGWDAARRCSYLTVDEEAALVRARAARAEPS